MSTGCGLTSLNNYVTKILSWTENVKGVLESECREARYVLRAWPIETIITKEIDESCCTCDSKASLEDHAEEIVEGIGRALAQAQELREKILMNVNKQKRKIREPDVQSIYGTLSNKTAANREEVVKPRKSSKLVRSAAPASRAGSSRGCPADVQRKNQIGPAKRAENTLKSITDRKLLRISASNTITASMGKVAKNFVASNKSNIKNLKSLPKSATDSKSGPLRANVAVSQQIGAGSSSQTSSSCSASIAELNRLMDKVSTEEAKRFSSSSSQDSRDRECPCHGTNAQNFVQERVRSTVDVIEGLDRFGVPGDVVKILKIYQSYSSTELSPAGDKRAQRAASRFQEEFRLLNEERDVREKTDDDRELENLIVGFGRLFRDSHCHPSAPSLTADLSNLYVELDSRSKVCLLKKFDPMEFRTAKKSKKLPATARCWSSNGVWNRFGLGSFPDARNMHVIRYPNRGQLSLFFELNQRLQQLLYHGRLTELLLEEVIPEVRSRHQHDSLEYSEIQHVYVKPRGQFGRWCNFEESDTLQVDIKSNSALMSDFVRVDPVSQGTQCNRSFAAHEVNTTTATFRESGLHHVEGGWPKDVNMHDLEQTVRYRRKVEKDELYIHTMLQLLPSMEHCIQQNNACNIYEQYFQDTEPAPLVMRTFSRTVNVYRDLVPIKRPITHLSWSPDQGTRLAVSYCNTDFKKQKSYSPCSYIWDIENPNNPFLTLKPFCPMLTMEYNPKDSNTLVSGLMSGQVAYWDIRRGSEPVETSLIEDSHRDPCNKVLWTNSKTGTEFFSASKDGQVKWWDTRKIQTPTETLVIDLTKSEEQDINRAVGISALQFEPSISTRFMLGLENGMVVSGNRKGKTPGEKIATRFKAQYGPVISVERNPTFVKNFLTVGDWTARIWSEDCRESCIIWTPGHREFLTGGAWSATRFSVFFLTKTDGTLDVWDLLVQQDSPVLSTKVCDDALTCIRPHEQGQLAAVAGKNGTTYLLEFSEALTTNQKNDKALLTALLDRETRREKVIESKNREMRLKMKSFRVEVDPEGQEGHQKESAQKCRIYDSNDPLIVQCEQDYEAAIEAELARLALIDDNEAESNNLQSVPLAAS